MLSHLDVLLSDVPCLPGLSVKHSSLLPTLEVPLHSLSASDLPSLSLSGDHGDDVDDDDGEA